MQEGEKDGKNRCWGRKSIIMVMNKCLHHYLLSQVNTLNGATSSPLQLVSYWKCEDNHTDLRIDYKYNPHAIASPSPLLNVNVMVPVDGIVKNMQSKPQGQW